MADRYSSQAEAFGARDNRGGARTAESDPLAELARLIGQTDPNALPGRAPAPQPQRANYSDRYQPVHNDQQQHYEQQPQYEDQQAEPAEQEPAPPSWMRTAASSWQQPQPAAQHAAPEQHYPQEQQHYQQEQEEYSDTPAFLRTARQHDPSRYDEVLYDQNSQNAQPQYADGQYADGQYQEGYQDQADPNGYPPFYGDGVEEEPRRKRGGLMTVVAVLALAIVGTAGAYAYRSYGGAARSGEPPVIKAETGASKIVPPTQTSDASGKIVDRIGGSGSGQERVLSREEQPIDMSRNAPRVVFPPTNGGSPQTIPATTQAQPAAANGAIGDEPKRVRTFAVRTDQPDVVPQQSSPPPRAPTQARAQAPTPGNAPMSLAPGATPARTQTAAASPPAAAPAPSRAGGFMVQISSQRSEADAQASYQAQQSKYPDVLGSRQASIRRVDLGEKGIYYRAYVGPFAAAEEAGSLCNNLKSAGGQCFVQRN
jgi:hypothetical protein